MQTPPDKPPRPPRRFSAIKLATRRQRPAAEPAVPEQGAVPVPAIAAEPAPVAVQTEAPPVSPPSPEKASDGARIAKVMARAGLCSRRDAEAWIAAGRVAVNGTVLSSPALDVGPTDVVTVDGYPIDKPERTRLFLFNKARGLVTTARDPEGRPTIFDALPPDLPRLVTVGRLDINTEGLLLLTNDGGLARLLELPSTGWIRRYRVRANGSITQPELDGLARGVTVAGVEYAGIAAKLDRVQGANLWLTMGLKEGKNREIKRVLEHLGLAVTRLIRISFGPFQLGELPDNAVEEVRTRVLRDQLGSALVVKAGLDLDGPINEAAAIPVERPGPPRHRSPVPAEPRRRTERAATADRRGRAVAVERITTQPAAGERTSRPRRPRPVSPDQGTWRADAAMPDRSASGSRHGGDARGRDGGRDARPARREDTGRPLGRSQTRRDPSVAGHRDRDERPRSGRVGRDPNARPGEARRDARPPRPSPDGRPNRPDRSGRDAGRAFRAKGEGRVSQGREEAPRRPQGRGPARPGGAGGSGRPSPGGNGPRRGGAPGGGKGGGRGRAR